MQGRTLAWVSLDSTPLTASLPTFAGIDVSEDFLDVVVLSQPAAQRFANDSLGAELLLAWLEPLAVTAIAIEASGGYQRLIHAEIYGYPAGWSAPSGWTEDTGRRVIYATSVTPSDFTLPSDLWGKRLLRVLVNGGTADDTSGLEILSTNGLHALPAGEGSQFGGAAERWGKHLEENLRTIDTGLSNGRGDDSNWPAVTVDGARSESGGCAVSALDRPRIYSDLALSNSTSLSMAGQRLVVTGTLTVGAGCVLHNDGATGSGATGGSGGGVQGQLASGNSPNGGSGPTQAVAGRSRVRGGAGQPGCAGGVARGRASEAGGRAQAEGAARAPPLSFFLLL